MKRRARLVVLAAAQLAALAGCAAGPEPDLSAHSFELRGPITGTRYRFIRYWLPENQLFPEGSAALVPVYRVIRE